MSASDLLKLDCAYHEIWGISHGYIQNISDLRKYEEDPHPGFISTYDKDRNLLSCCITMNMREKINALVISDDTYYYSVGIIDVRIYKTEEDAKYILGMYKQRFRKIHKQEKKKIAKLSNGY